MKRFLLAVLLVLTVSCLMSARKDMAPTNEFTVTVLPDGQHKIDWVLDGDGRTVRSYNILYFYKRGDNRILSAQIRLLNTAQFPTIPESGTVIWNPWAGNKHRSISYDATICVFSDDTDPTQSDCYYSDVVSFRK